MRARWRAKWLEDGTYNSRYRITGATSFNTPAKRPNYIYRYAEPTTWSFSINTRL